MSDSPNVETSVKDSLQQVSFAPTAEQISKMDFGQESIVSPVLAEKRAISRQQLAAKARSRSTIVTKGKSETSWKNNKELVYKAKALGLGQVPGMC